MDRTTKFEESFKESIGYALLFLLILAKFSFTKSYT
jgi:hypothetical protein